MQLVCDMVSLVRGFSDAGLQCQSADPGASVRGNGCRQLTRIDSR